MCEKMILSDLVNKILLGKPWFTSTKICNTHEFSNWDVDLDYFELVTILDFTEADWSSQ